jgi:MFS family permease
MTALSMRRVREIPFLRALSTRDFRLLWGSEAISVVGDQFHYIALSWFVISLTGSGLALGSVLLAIAVPRAVLLVPFGVLADRRPSRGLMLVAHLVRGAVVGAIAALALTGMATLPLLALLGAIFGAADALYLPAQQAFLPRTLEADRLPSGNALLQGTMQLSSIVGPPIAGAAIAVTSTGFAFAVDAVSFLIAAVVIALIGTPTVGPRSAAAAEGSEESAKPEPFLAAITSGIRYVLKDNALRTTMLISLVLNFALNGPASVGMPWLADQRFDAGPAGLGFMAAALSAGALAGVIVAGSISPGRRGRSLLLAVVLIGIGAIGVGVLPSLAAVVIALALIGVAIGYANIVAISWIQIRVEPSMMGRVMSLVMFMSVGITPLSLVISGWLVDVSATGLFVGAGVAILLTAVFAVAVRFVEQFDGTLGPGGEPTTAAGATG